MAKLLKANVLLRSGREMPRLGLGTSKLLGSDIHKSLKSGIALGYRLVDIAPGSEAMARIALASYPRESLFLTVRVNHGSREDAKTSTLKILQGLKQKYVDLLVLWSPGARGLSGSDIMNREQRHKAWKELEELQGKGIARSLGLCDFSIAHIQDLLQVCSVPPSVLQAEISPLNTEHELLAYCQAQNIALQAYSPLAGGHSDLLLDPKLQEIASIVGKTPCQVILQWGLQRGLSVITRSRNQSHQRENAELDFVLGSSHMQALNSLNTGFRVGWRFLQIS